MLESAEATLSNEQVAKTTLMRQKKKLEKQISELEAQADMSCKATLEAESLSKKLQTRIQELQSECDEEMSKNAELRQSASAAEYRVSLLVLEVGEAKATIDHLEKYRLSVENELHEATERIGELTVLVGNAAVQKRKIESELAVARAELDDAINEAKNSEEKVKRATDDAARLAEELRQEQVNINNILGENIRPFLTLIHLKCIGAFSKF